MKFIKNTVFTTVRVVSTLVILFILIGIYFIFANQNTPYSNQAIIYGKVIKLSPEVSGNIVKIYPTLQHQFVKKNSIILQIQRRPFLIALHQAQDRLVLAENRTSQLNAIVKQMTADISLRQAEYIRALQYYNQIKKLYATNAVALTKLQMATANLKATSSALIAAKNKRTAAKQALGKSIKGVNIHVKAARDNLAMAQYHLNKTSLRAPVDGFVENIYIHKGAYAQPGKTSIPFILANSGWVECLMKQNTLHHLYMGMPALMVTSLIPGKIFKVSVTSLGHGVNQAYIKPSLSLPSYTLQKQWFEPMQVFPIGVNLPQSLQEPKNFRVGANASVVILKPHSWFWNGLAYFVMWIKSLWAYI